MDCSVIGTKQINVTYSRPNFFPKETIFFLRKLFCTQIVKSTWVLHFIMRPPGYTQSKCSYIFLSFGPMTICFCFFSHSLFIELFYFSIFVLESLIHYNFLFNCVLIFFQVCQPFGNKYWWKLGHLFHHW